MICPVCSKELKKVIAGSIEVDLCDDGCGGMWFDEFELRKFDDGQEMDADKLLNAKKSPDFYADPNVPKACPKCDGQIMWRHFYDIKNKVQVDQCPHCSGVWLDAGELALIREQYQTEEERDQAVNTYLSSYLTQTEEQLKQDSFARTHESPEVIKKRFSKWMSVKASMEKVFRGLLNS